MLWNTLKRNCRSLRRHAGYTAINVVGLALGIAACLLIALYVRHELSYDDFHEDAEQIHRIVGDYGETVMPAIQLPAIAEIRRKNPSLAVTSFFQSDAVVGRDTRRVHEGQLFVARPSFFDVFTFPVRQGTAKKAFDQPNTAVLTPKKARRYFGDQNPVGKTLEVTGFPLQRDTTVTVTVTGVLEPIPDASHFHPEMIVSWATLDAAVNFTERKRDNWSGGVFRAYLKIPEGTSPSALAEEFTRQVKERAKQTGDPFGGELWLQPVTDIHLHSDLSLELEPNGSAAYVYVFGFVALVILVLAGVNFVNLALARSVERTREVGVRKSIGATRGQIARQFLAEALLLAGGAAVLAVGLVAGALPVFRSVTGIEGTASMLAEPFSVATLLGISFLVALGSAAYPAFVLSRHHPARVLGGRSNGGFGSGGAGGSRLRRGLVVFQFAVAVALGAGTITAYWQLNYLQEADLGFRAEQVATLPMPPMAKSSPARTRAFKREATRQPGVRAVSKASEAVPAGLPRNAEFAFANTDEAEGLHDLRLVTVGPDFFKAMGMDVTAGRSFDRSRAADSSAVVVNRAAFRQLARDLPAGERSPEQAVGRPLRSGVFWLSEQPTLIGVVENAHLSPLYDAIAPTVFLLTPPSLNDTFYLRVEGENARQVLSQVEAVWQEVFPKAPLTYTFVDQAFAEAYRAERRTSTLISVFAGLALGIACLGLFGLAAVAARQRRQEIGIRKAIGASAGQIVTLLSKDFARLVGVAIVVAVPLAYVGLSQWLDTFAYHIDLGPSVFLIAGSGALAAALLAVSVQALRAARIDPATVLRNE